MTPLPLTAGLPETIAQNQATWCKGKCLDSYSTDTETKEPVTKSSDDSPIQQKQKPSRL